MGVLLTLISWYLIGKELTTYAQVSKYIWQRSPAIGKQGRMMEGNTEEKWERGADLHEEMKVLSYEVLLGTGP